MKRLVDLLKLERLDTLIRRAATGSPEKLAERLEMSRSNLFNLISFLKEEMKAPIVYSAQRLSYIYTYTPKFYLNFDRDQLKTDEMENIYGGNDENEENNKAKNNNISEFILDDDIDFNNLYY